MRVPLIARRGKQVKATPFLPLRSGPKATSRPSRQKKFPGSLSDFEPARGLGNFNPWHRDKQFPPHMMLALLIYSYANGLFSSRKIERATHRDVAIRYLCAGTHPDHDTICKFRRENFEAFRESFVDVLELARELKLLELGNVSLDGIHLKANASIDQNVNYQRAVGIRAQLRLDIEELEARARQRQQKAEAKYEEKKAERREKQKKTGKKCTGRDPKRPEKKAEDSSEQCNLSDPDARIMRKNKRASFTQSYCTPTFPVPSDS